MTPKVALVTRGATGIGEAVVQALSARGGWHIHVVDVKPAPSRLPASTTYHQADEDGSDEPPPEPDYSVVNVNLMSCVNTVRLARHYMAQSPDRDSRAIWPTYCLPLYTASKFLANGHADGVLGFVRSVADWFRKSDGIRINTLCPSAVRTPLLSRAAWDAFEQAGSLTSLGLVVRVVLMFCDGDVVEDSDGRRAPANYGQTVVPCGEQFYLNDLPPFTNAGHEAMVRALAVDRQAHII